MKLMTLMAGLVALALVGFGTAPSISKEVATAPAVTLGSDLAPLLEELGGASEATSAGQCSCSCGPPYTPVACADTCTLGSCSCSCNCWYGSSSCSCSGCIIINSAAADGGHGH